MTEVSFYILSATTEQEKLIFVCKLLEKIYLKNFYCYVLTDNIEQSRNLDNLLWTFRPSSFVPHQLFLGEKSNSLNKVLIGSVQPPEGWQETIINLSSNCPPKLLQTTKILEIIHNNTTTKDIGRQHYRHYQQLGIAIKTHQIY